MRDWAQSRRLGTPADEAGYVFLRQPPASKLANLCRIDTSKEPSADPTRFLETNFFASTVCETSSRHVRWDNVHHAYTGDPRRTKTTIHSPLVTRPDGDRRRRGGK